MTKVHAFYGFKGGTGRSLVMAHVASMLAAEGKKVLMIDADLEAPGLGDFFDEFGRTTFEEWRGMNGLMDLLRSLAGEEERGLLTDDRNLAASIEHRMLGEKGLLRPSGQGLLQIELGRAGGGEAAGPPVSLLGPGNHSALSSLGAQRYVANFLDFDWNAFLRQDGSRLLRALGMFWRDGPHGFDHVLIDARTGYNLASIVLIQHWATHLVGVSTWGWQSIDGMARMLPVARRVQWRDEPIPTFLVMNKTSLSDSRRPSLDIVRNDLLPRYFGEGVDGIQRIELPYAHQLQTDDRLAWTALDRDQYNEARHRLLQRRSTEREYRDLMELSEEAIVAFCDGIARLYACLTERTGDFDAQPIFKKLFKKAFNVQAGGKEDGAKDGSMTLEDALDRVRSWLLAEEIARRDEQIPDGVVESFRSRSKEERALWRAALLDLVMEVGRSRDGRSVVSNSLLEELQKQFALDLDPTSATEYIAAAIKAPPTEVPGATQSHLSDAVVLAIRALCKDPLSDEAEKQIEALAEQASGAYYAETVSLLLRRYRAAFARDGDVGDASSALRVVAADIARAVRERRPSLPTDSASLVRWNLLDLITPLALRIGKVWYAAGRTPDRATSRELSNLADVLIGHLSDAVFTESFEKLASSSETLDVIDARDQWRWYVEGAVRLRRLAGCTTGGLEPNEAAALRRAAALPDLDTCAKWDWSRRENVVTVIDTGAVQAAVCSLYLGSGVRAESARVIEIASVLGRRVLSNRMTVLESPGGVPNSHLARTWAVLLRRLFVLAGPSGDARLDLHAARRAVRLLATNGVKQDESSVIDAAEWGMVVVHDLGQGLSPAWSEASSDDASASATDGAESKAWAGMVHLCDEGKYLEAAALFEQHLPGFPDVPVPDTKASWTSLAALSFCHVALTELGRRDAASTILRRATQAAAAEAPGLGFQQDGRLGSMVLGQVKMLTRLGADKAALDVLDELDMLDTACLAARGRLAVARLYRALLSGVGPDFDLRAAVEASLAAVLRRLPAGPDRLAADAADVDWHGTGLFFGGATDLHLDIRLAGTFVPAMELSLRWRPDEARALLSRWARLTERQTPGDIIRTGDLNRSHSAALIAAFRAELEPREARRMHVEEALRRRQADLDANGPERGSAYERVFTLCGIG
ncbi:MAG TPA: hypothetical protein VF339_04240 [Gammaproteobacteria bacterium]